IVCAAGRHLGAARCAFAEIEPDQAHAVIHRDYCDGAASLAGRHRLADFGAELVRLLRRGETVAVGDAATDPRTRGAPAFVAVRPHAGVAVPLVKGGRLVAVFTVQHHAPRRWAAEEVRFIERVAERAWLAAEGARSEQALRRSETLLRLVWAN